MNDMSQVIIPKSDQISADDFIAGPRTYTIDAVEIRPSTEQPVSIFLADEPRAWKPCKSMSRCLVAAWGPDANTYIGRSVTLYRDPKVKWGGMEVGGIRVSHLSHIEREMLLQLTATKGKRAPHIVKPLAEGPRRQVDAPPADAAAKWADQFITNVGKAPDLDALEDFAAKRSGKLADLATADPALHQRCTDALNIRRTELDIPEGRAGADMGDGFADEFEGE